MSKVHEIKTNVSLWPDLRKYNKRAEFRLNDRDDQVGDKLNMRPVDDAGNAVANATPMHQRFEVLQKSIRTSI